MHTGPIVAPPPTSVSDRAPREELPTKRLLVVHDSAPMRAILRSMLSADKSAQWEVTEAGSGAELLTALTQQPFLDIVVLDMQMPGMNGFAACRAMRELNHRVPVLFVTAEGHPGSFTQGRLSGGDSYLVKPFSASGLKTALHALIAGERRQTSGS